MANDIYYKLFDDKIKHNIKIEAIYIACYLGTGEIKEKRWEIYQQQIEYFKDIDVYVVNMEFEIFQDNVTHLNTDNDRKSLIEARNMCLDHFYNSDYDYAFIADNDSWLDDSIFEGRDALDAWNNHPYPQDMDGIDMWAPTFGLSTMGSYGRKKLFKDFMIFQRSYYMKGSLRALRNLKKHYGIEIYIPDNFKDNIDGEDVALAILMLQKGLGCYLYCNVTLKEVCDNGLSFYGTDGDPNKRDSEKVFNNMCNLLKIAELQVKNGKLDYSGLIKTLLGKRSGSLRKILK